MSDRVIFRPSLVPPGDRRRRSLRVIGVVVAVSAVLAACSTSTEEAASSSDDLAASGTTVAGPGTTTPGGGPGDAAGGPAFPGDRWAEATAEEAGLDPLLLAELAAEAEAAGSNCLAVVRDGKLVGEWYFNGTDAESTQEVFSATKTYTAMLVGIAQDQGLLDISDPAADYIPEWQGTPSQSVTVRNLLANDSGRHWDFNTDYVEMAVRAPDKTAFAVDLDQDAEPGTVWAYNNAAIQTLDAVMQAATGEPTTEFAQRELLDPIGATSSRIRQDAAGNTLTFMGLESSCRDMARFGHLLANGGSWDGRQVIPADYVAEATSPSNDLNDAYGYLTWLNRVGRLANPVDPMTAETRDDALEGQMVPGAPEDLFFALGLGGQVILVSPSTGVVVVRLAPVNRTVSSTAGFGPAAMARVVTEGIVD